jgi:hypothetical protein
VVSQRETSNTAIFYKSEALHNVGRVWITSDYGDRLAGFRVEATRKSKKDKNLQHQEHLTNIYFMRSHFAIFTSAANAT